jgi:hypothetical protein
VEYYATGAARFAGDANGGFGARLLLRVGSSAALLDRVALGGYAARIPAGPGFGRTEYGLQTELSAGPGASLDPLLTLGLGAVRREGRWVWRPARRPLRVPAPGATTSLALAPGVGARLRVGRGVALRGDLRRALALDRDGVSATEVAAGISLAL